MQHSLRPWRLTDLDDLVTFANNPNVAKFLTDKFPNPYTMEAGEKFIANAISKVPASIFAIEVEGRAAGGIGLHPRQDIECKNAELGYWLAEPYWNQGIITRSIRQIVEYGFHAFDITRIYARPFGHNEASRRVLEKAGFVLEATIEKCLYKNGEYMDELIYAVRKID